MELAYNILFGVCLLGYTIQFTIFIKMVYKTIKKG